MKKLAAVLLVLLLAGCTLPAIPTDIVTIVTLTSTPTVRVTATSTPEPTATPTLTPTPGILTPTPIEFISECVYQEFSIVCVANVCQVRNDHVGGDEVRAYTVPNGTIIRAFGDCTFSDNPVFPDWFYLGYQESTREKFWAANVTTVWEKTN